MLTNPKVPDSGFNPDRHYFMDCYNGEHERCSVERNEIYRGKPRMNYCECPCHATREVITRQAK